MNSIEKINKDLQRAFSQFGVTAEQAVKNLRANMADMDTSDPDAPKYEYGVEYECDGVKPELPDDVMVEVCANMKGRMFPYTVGGNTAWEHTARFRIVDERFKPTQDAPEPPQATNTPEPIATHHLQEKTLQEAIDATAALNEQYGEDAIHEHLQRLMDLQWERLTPPTSAL